jgi:MobA/MobL family
MKTFGRSGGKRGSRATSAAAYRAGERIRDDRTGAVYDHHRRRDVLHKEIVLPAAAARAGRDLDWARNRTTLWNAAEHAEGRKNSRVAREFVVGLPHELSHEQRTGLARQFAQELADRYRNAVDIAIHAPRGDARNFHAHLLATTREITSEGLGPKTTLELSGTERYRRGLPRWREETSAIRERWAVMANQALERAHVAARLSYLSPEAVRARQISHPRLPVAAFRIEQRGGRSIVGERIRADRAELGRSEPDRSAPPKEQAPARTRTIEAQLPPARTSAQSLERLWEQVRGTWAALRSRLQGRVPTRLPSPAMSQARGPEQETREFQPEQGEVPRQEVRSGPVLGPEERARAAARAWLRYREAQRQGSTLESDRARAPERAKTHEFERDYDLGL